MIKFVHLSFILFSLISFVGRFALSIVKPEVLEQKMFKIAPHVINGILLLSGILLVFQGNWLDGAYGWIIGKIVLILAYIYLGLMAFKLPNKQHRMYAFAGGIACFLTIAMIAVKKSVFFFL